jgi:membrane-associated protease RseP (regulator of RpoE activity)
MQPQQNFGSPGAGEQSCAQCGSPMPKEMRFCRTCGNRLGEGPAEYTETVRFPGATAQNRGGQTTPFYPTFNAPMTTVNPPGRRRRLGWKGTTWLWIAMVFIFGMGGLMSLARKGGRFVRPPAAAFATKLSWVGVDGFTTTDNGVTFRTTDIAGGPADKAGLVGGDVITSFDGIKVRTSSELNDLLTKIPTGKQVEVIFLRDGISHTTQLSTVSRDEYNRLQNEFDRRPEGKGMFGFESDRMQRVNNPETKTFGVQINYIEPNGPADLFGIQKGDIITDFDKVPIRTPDEFLARVRRAVPRSVVSIKLLRNGQPMVVPVTMGSAGR